MKTALTTNKHNNSKMQQQTNNARIFETRSNKIEMKKKIKS